MQVAVVGQLQTAQFCLIFKSLKRDERPGLRGEGASINDGPGSTNPGVAKDSEVDGYAICV